MDGPNDELYSGVPSKKCSRREKRARSGHGQFLQIMGEPGIGKARLVEQFHARPDEIPHTWLEFSSSQLLQNTPLHPITALEGEDESRAMLGAKAKRLPDGPGFALRGH
jgi:predicted ATPase